MHRITLGLFTLFLLSVSSHSAKAQIVSFIEQQDDAYNSELLSTIALPDSLIQKLAVSINTAELEALSEGDSIPFATSANQLYEYVVDSRTDFLNGDVSWSASFREIDQVFGFSLTKSSNILLGTIYSPEGKFSLLAVPSANAVSLYQGWMYVTAVGDFGGIDGDDDEIVRAVKFSELMIDRYALSGSDVTITQTLSDEIAIVGEQVTFSVTVTNNLATAITDENLVVWWVLDNSTLIDSSPGCSQTTYVSGGNFLECTIGEIAPSGNIAIDFTVQLIDSSHPYITSGVFVDEVSDIAYVDVTRDTLVDSDGDGVSDFNEEILDTDPDDSDSRVGSDYVSEVDLMFLYTQKFADDIGHAFPDTEINQMVELTNSMFANSGAMVKFRPMLYEQVDFVVNDDINGAWDTLSSGSHPEFAFVPHRRSGTGADIVVFIDGDIDQDEACGLGNVPGRGRNGELFHRPGTELYIIMYRNCSHRTLAHELGHNFGMGHSRLDADSTGTFPWSFGHGIQGIFHTIMARFSDYPGAESLPLFADPDSSDCKGFPCGILRRDLEQGADAVHTLNHSRFQVANLRDSKLINTATLSGDSSSLLMFGAATKNGNADVPVNDFSPTDSIDVRATLQIPPEHREQTGQTYVVVSVDDIGLFFRDHEGAYILWDGAIETLGGNTRPHALNSIEELVAFSDFVAADHGVDAATMVFFFAYSVADTDVFVYSATGVPVSIQ